VRPPLLVARRPPCRTPLILAERLGIHQARAAQWVRAAGATYSGYVEVRLARDVGDVL
jgi:hypothetical protein